MKRDKSRINLETPVNRKLLLKLITNCIAERQHGESEFDSGFCCSLSFIKETIEKCDDLHPINQEGHEEYIS